jgi:Leucine-rich repeat (LRR) protein
VDERPHCQIRRLTLENSGLESEINPGFHPAVFNSCPELEYLNLNNIGLRFTPGIIVGVNLQEIVLTSVTINRFDFLVPCSKLRRLTFEQVDLTENQLFDFSSPILEYLRIINCDNFSCDSQEGRFPNLIELRLEDAELANVGFIEQLVSLRRLTLQCPQAESLNLGRLVFLQRVELIYHHGGLLMGHHPILTELTVTGNCASLLDLTGCLALTTLTLYGLPIERLDGLRNCRQLIKLDLTFCQYIKSIAVIENFPLLEEIVLDFSSDITNFDSLALCHNLRKISLEWTDITSVDKLASLPRLDWLNLRECRNITIRHPLFNDGKLKYLDLTKTGL